MIGTALLVPVMIYKKFFGSRYAQLMKITLIGEWKCHLDLFLALRHYYIF